MRIVNGRSRTTIGTSCAPTLAGALALVAGTGLAIAQPGVQPGDRIAGVQTGADFQAGLSGAQPANEEEMVSFDQFAEAVELTTLVNFVGEVLGINIVIKGTLAGSITFNAEVEVPLSELLPMLRALLEQWDYTITSTEVPGLYTVLPVGDIAPVMGGTTRVFPTPNVKPSLLVEALTSLLGGAPNQIRAVDELGVIVATAPPLQLDRINRMVEEFLALYRAQEYTRIELDYIAAPTARERAIGLVGGSTDAFARQNLQGRQVNQQNAQTGALGLGGSGLDNLGERLAVDAQGNALIFRGTQDELATVIQIIDVIDVPNTLSPRNYFAGSAALQIADIASQQGLGEVITLQTSQDNNIAALQQRNINPQTLGQGAARTGGPVMVVDPNRQSIIYYGTASQQEQLAALMEELKTEDDRIVIREYKLNYADSEAVADLITGLITGQSAAGDAPLLPGGTGQTSTQQAQNFVRGGGGGDDEIGVFDPNRVFVIADPDNNQVVVKAPLKQQDEFGKLVERLDLRRPQVFIEATIVSVSDNSDFRLAIETQLTSGQWTGSTDFGLSTPGANFNNARSVSTGLAGLTTAVIKSQYVPVIVNAIKTDTDSKILSRPSLLVNDNEEARIVSLEQQPTTSTSQGDATTETSFDGFEDAGTTLEVTPSISEAGSLSLQYRIELSNFVGSGANGIPAPRQERTVEGQVTIPSDATIVVGGIKVDNVSDTVVKVPLLGDIPLVGHAFRDTQKVNNSSTLYVFLTPRIMTDPNFYDLKLFSQGPQSAMDLEDDIPSMEPVRIEMRTPTATPWQAPPPPPSARPEEGEPEFLEVDLNAPAPVIELDGSLTDAGVGADR
ncbi:MAG: type II secretion system protein GspD [Phycisphaerales bacterium JB059]